MTRDEGSISIFQVVGVVALVLLLIMVLIFVFGSWTTVEAGHRGVLIRMGAVQTEVLPEGVASKRPWFDHVVQVNVQVQNEEVKTEASSRDLQIVHTTVAANLRVIPEQAATLYQRVGVDYLPTVVAPAIQESVKEVTARYTAEELITKREDAREAMQQVLSAKLQPFGIALETVNITNFDFSPTFNASIEAKVTAEQNALAAKNKLSQIEFEAQQAAASAKGRADAIRAESDALRSNPQVLQLRAIEKWDGKLPQLIGGNGAIPFINIDAEKAK